MSFTTHSIVHALALAALSAAGLHAAPARAATIPVANCADSGPGSLREAVAGAGEGDILDMTAISCFTVRLLSPIVIEQDNLDIGFYPRGNQVGMIEIDAQHNGRVFLHNGAGRLRLENLILFNGLHSAALATGGCVHSEGDLELYRTYLWDCEARGEGGAEPMALGGAVHARNVLLHGGSILDNVASGANGFGGGISSEGRTRLLYADVNSNRARNGGGIHTMGGLTMTYSNVWANNAYDNAGIHVLAGSVTIAKSTLAVNTATHRCGAVCVEGTGRTSILDSTLSLNRARWLSAGDLTHDAKISNSTITQNTDTAADQCVGVVRARGEITLMSTILAGNFCNAPGTAYDLGGRPWLGDVFRGFSNFIGHSRLPLGPGSLRGDPRLGPLGQHGNLDLQVHMPLPDSPVIDAGYNVYDRLYDERGPGYPRVVGAAPDIGAVEWSPDPAASTRIAPTAD
ncbi:MAG TPA: choice-of-anchor Q domain-containing protein [Lysobacter sp.]